MNLQKNTPLWRNVEKPFVPILEVDFFFFSSLICRHFLTTTSLTTLFDFYTSYFLVHNFDKRYFLIINRSWRRKLPKRSWKHDRPAIFSLQLDAEVLYSLLSFFSTNIRRPQGDLIAPGRPQVLSSTTFRSPRFPISSSSRAPPSFFLTHPDQSVHCSDYSTLQIVYANFF